MELGNVDFVIDAVRIINTPMSSTTNADPDSGSATSFDNIHYFLMHHKYPSGLILNQKRTLRKAAANFALIGKSYPHHLVEIFIIN
jgi:hypothetical protein